MKTLRMIGMALVVVLMCVNFASCNDDDDAIELSAYSKEIVGKWEITSYAAMGTWHDSYVFNNDGTKEELYNQVVNWWNEYNEA